MGIDVKICGLTTLEDARVACDAGADYLGFVFYAKSPRAVAPACVADIIATLDIGARAVGLFVNEAPEKAMAVARECGLGIVQLHGDETAEPFDQFPLPIWRAIRVRDGRAVPAPEAWLASRYVIDADVSGVYGGTGVKADWEMAAALAESYSVMLAGGLRADNVAAAIARVQPAGVDVSSGVEAEPGRKDHAAVRRFVAAAKAAK